MNRISLLTVAVGVLFVLPAGAQDLPAPPKPPKSKANGQAIPEQAVPDAAQKSPSDAAPLVEGREGGRILGDGIRPRRLRINAPFFHMDLDFGGRGVVREAIPYREAPRVRTEIAGEAVPAPRADEIPSPAAQRDDQTWRYRWHEGHWWYWLPSERWVYWDGGRWNEFGRPAGRRLGAMLRNGNGGINLGDLMQGDEIRIGTPRRGNVELELEGLPPVNIGF